MACGSFNINSAISLPGELSLESKHPVWHAVDTKERAKHGWTATLFLLSKSKMMGEALPSFVKLAKTQWEEVHTGGGLGKGFSGIKAKLGLENSEFPETECCGCRRVKSV